jgi:hypothetical protein
MPGLREYRRFLDDLEGELSRLETLISGTGMSGSPCRPGCSACCLPLTLLPLEAYAIMSECDHPGADTRAPRDAHPVLPCAAGRPDAGDCPDCAFLTPDRTCAIYPSRPFLCRTRGFPILHLNEDGEWELDSCAARGFPMPVKGTVGLRLESWNVRLYHLNEAFCVEQGLASCRVHMTDLRAGSLAAASPA